VKEVLAFKPAHIVRDVPKQDVAMVKEYACMQGLVALDGALMGDLDDIHAAMLKVKEEGLWSKPVYT